jgi:flagellar assembly factor FliW
MQGLTKLNAQSEIQSNEAVAVLPLDKSRKISHDLIFPKGLIGLSDYQHYRLLEVDNPLYTPLKMLINVEEPTISLLVINIADLDETIIRAEDFMDAPFNYLQNQSTIGCYFILTVRKTGAELLFTANTRAPLFIDHTNNTAVQYIVSQRYDYAYPLEGFSTQIRQRRALARD